MQDLNDLYFFAQVVEHGGFAAASRALDTPRSRLSRRVGQLEERLGVRLIHRSTRRFSVTEIGREYLRHCLAMLVEAEAAQEAIDRVRAEPQGLVRVSCLPVLLYSWGINAMLARFMAENPKVELHLEITNRRVDVIHEGFDIALRADFPPLEESDLVMKVLVEYTHRLVASPSFFDRFARPRAPADLRALPSIIPRELYEADEWYIEGPNGATARVPHRPRFIVTDVVATRLAVLQGVGVAALPTAAIEPDLQEGALVDVLPGWAPPAGLVYALFPSRRGLLPSVRVLLDFLAVKLAASGRATAQRPRAEPVNRSDLIRSAVRDAIGDKGETNPTVSGGLGP
jgi:DNA-binding transcriptional LysR family regulator